MTTRTARFIPPGSDFRFEHTALTAMAEVVAHGRNEL